MSISTSARLLLTFLKLFHFYSQPPLHTCFTWLLIYPRLKSYTRPAANFLSVCSASPTTSCFFLFLSLFSSPSFPFFLLFVLTFGTNKWMVSKKETIEMPACCIFVFTIRIRLNVASKVKNYKVKCSNLQWTDKGKDGPSMDTRYTKGWWKVCTAPGNGTEKPLVFYIWLLALFVFHINHEWKLVNWRWLFFILPFST